MMALSSTMLSHIITQDHIIISRGPKRSQVEFEPNYTGNCSGSRLQE